MFVASHMRKGLDHRFAFILFRLMTKLNKKCLLALTVALSLNSHVSASDVVLSSDPMAGLMTEEDRSQTTSETGRSYWLPPFERFNFIVHYEIEVEDPESKEGVWISTPPDFQFLIEATERKNEGEILRALNEAQRVLRLFFRSIPEDAPDSPWFRRARIAFASDCRPCPLWAELHPSFIKVHRRTGTTSIAYPFLDFSSLQWSRGLREALWLHRRLIDLRSEESIQRRVFRSWYRAVLMSRSNLDARYPLISRALIDRLPQVDSTEYLLASLQSHLQWEQSSDSWLGKTDLSPSALAQLIESLLTLHSEKANAEARIEAGIWVAQYKKQWLMPKEHPIPNWWTEASFARYLDPHIPPNKKRIQKCGTVIDTSKKHLPKKTAWLKSSPRDLH